MVKAFFQELPPEQFLVGRTKVFMRHNGYQAVVDLFLEKVKIKNEAALRIQRSYKGMKWRHGIRRHLEFIRKIKRKVRGVVARARWRIYLKKVIVI